MIETQHSLGPAIADVRIAVLPFLSLLDAIPKSELRDHSCVFNAWLLCADNMRDHGENPLRLPTRNCGSYPRLNFVCNIHKSAVLREVYLVSMTARHCIGKRVDSGIHGG
jgi:hypothetical protein